jgi:hypothetical protein
MKFRTESSGVAGTASRARRSPVKPKSESFVYRGVRIEPVRGRRSALADDIRDGLRALSEKERGDKAAS